MQISFKVLLIPGLNEKTLSGTVDTDERTNLLWLLEYIDSRYGVNLLLHDKDFIALLDGKSIDLGENRYKNISSCSDLFVFPMISGG